LPFAANILVTIAPKLRESMIYTAHLGETRQRVVDPLLSPDVYLSKRAAKTVALNPEMRAAFEQEGVSFERLTVIPNGVDLERFQDLDQGSISKVENKYDLENKKIVLFVGTITPRKGVLDLVRAANRLLSDTENKDVKFVLAGKKNLDLDYAEKLQNEIDRFGLENQVVLTGFIPNDELLALYDRADLFVLPSFEEGSSIAISEAIASGTPVIASDIGGNAQQIDDGTHAYLVEPGNEKILANRIEYSLTNPDVRMSMQQAIKDRGREVSWKEISQKYMDTYKEITHE
jgi:glycosyltransferase involved in cell wall biosynthesis